MMSSKRKENIEENRRKGNDLALPPSKRKGVQP